MPLVDPPYPSFTHVVMKMYPPSSPPLDSSRLPCYRAAHVGRFHPYPRGPRRNTGAIYTPTVEYSVSLDPIVEEPEVVVLRPLAVYYEKGLDADSTVSAELGKPDVGSWCTEELKVPARSATGFAVALKLFLRSTRSVLLAMRVFSASSKE